MTNKKNLNYELLFLANPLMVALHHLNEASKMGNPIAQELCRFMDEHVPSKNGRAKDKAEATNVAAQNKAIEAFMVRSPKEDSMAHLQKVMGYLEIASARPEHLLAPMLLSQMKLLIVRNEGACSPRLSTSPFFRVSCP